MTTLHRTILFDAHVQLGAKMVEFGGWDMPVQYPDGILAEHLATREQAGAFDVSHMGRLSFTGKNVVPFLQYVLTNNAGDLDVGDSQYTIIANESGVAIDDAYLYRFTTDEYLLVVNASNREKDHRHLADILKLFPDVTMDDQTLTTAMIALQGPESQNILARITGDNALPRPGRNHLSVARVNGHNIRIGRTGYTGEENCFELFMEDHQAPSLWEELLNQGAAPVGLGARDTLRLEASLPLYGRELGLDATGREIPVFALKLARCAVSFSPEKGDFIGKKSLEDQSETRKRILNHDYSNTSALPGMIMPLVITGKGIARAGYRVFLREKHIGHITSGTTIPRRLHGDEEKISGKATQNHPIALALIDSLIRKDDIVEIEIRKKRCKAIVAATLMEF